LVEEVMRMPTNANDRLGSFKYPFAAQEVLKSESDMILNHFFKKPEQDKSSAVETPEGQEKETSDTEETGPSKSTPYFNKTELDRYVKSFLKLDYCQDTVLSGYYQSILSSFFGRNSKNLQAYFYSDPELGQLMLERLSNLSISMVFRSFLNYFDEEEAVSEDFFEESPEQANQVFNARVGLYKKVMELFLTTQDLETKANIKGIYIHLLSNIAKIPKAASLIDEALFADGSAIEALVSKLFGGVHSALT
jgi:hypothetical protein